MQSLPEGYQALVIGASGAIGSAFLEQLQRDPRCGRVVGLSRSSQPAIDFENPGSIETAAVHMRSLGPFHLVVLATGTLHSAQGMPERKLAQLNYAQMESTFRINTIGPALAIAHFTPLLDK